MNKGMIKAAAALTAAAVFLSYSPETVSERALARPAVKSEFSVPLPVFKTVTGAADAMEPVLVYGTEDTAETEPEAYPSEYDMRAEYPVTAVRNQSGYGTCWAHTVYASLESNILRSQKTSNSIENTDVAPAGMTLSRRTAVLALGSSLTLAKKITPVNASDKSVVWLSSNESVATVDTNGTIRAVGVGTATVFAATVTGGITASCSVVVESDSVAEKVAFEENTITKTVGDVFMIAYSVTPMRASTDSLNWISTNPLIAAVNDNGVIAALTSGTTQISIVSDTGAILDTVTVIVEKEYDCTVADIDSSLTRSGSNLSGDVSVSLINNTGSVRSASVMLAIYDKDGSLAGITITKRNLSEGENKLNFTNLTFNNIAQGEYTIKCLVWDTSDNINPLSTAFNITVN